MTEKAMARSRAGDEIEDRRPPDRSAGDRSAGDRGAGDRREGDREGQRRDGAGPEADRGRLETLLGYFLRRADVFTFQSFNTHLGEDRISPGQLGVLLMCQANAGINQTRLGKALGIDRSTLVAMIDLLEGRGLVARTPSATDRRSHALKLTRPGEAFLKALQPRLARHEAEIARNLSAAERRQLMDLLTRIAPP